jgi:hypothetical protein
VKIFIVRAIIFALLICVAFSASSCSSPANIDTVKTIDIALTDEEYVFVCKKGNIALVNSFNSFLDEIEANGKYDALVSKYFEGKGTKIGYVGNLLQFFNKDTQNLVGEAVIQEVIALANGSYELIMDRELSLVAEGDLVENDTLSANFLFENNHLYHCPQVRASDNGKLIVRNNIFEECIALLVDDLIDYWRETGCVNDLTITDNTFINTPWAGGDNGAINIFTTRIPTCEVRHKNIKITNNIFKNTANNPVQIKVEYADNVIIENNSFACGNMDKLITVKSCNDLKIENNQIKD